jgi:hypothetical protein
MGRLLLAPGIAVALVVSACSEDTGCEEARSTVTNTIKSVCDQVPYSSSPFCMTCVQAGYYDTTGPTNCECKTLTFEQGSCTSLPGKDTTADVRNAIDWANQTCSSFHLPSSDGGAEARPDRGFPSDGGSPD